MQQKQFIEIINQPGRIEPLHLQDLEILVKEYPFFESAHLLYTKGLHKHQPVNYSKQLRKTAIIANSRSVLYELLHRPEVFEVKKLPEVIPEIHNVEVTPEPKTDLSPVSVTNSDIKIIYVNTVPSPSRNVEQEEVVLKAPENEEINIVKAIENDTEVPVQEFNIDKLNKTIEQEINQGIIESYVQTDIIKTPELNKEEVSEPSTFTDWLKTIQKEAPTFQVDVKKEPEIEKNRKNEVKEVEKEKKTRVFEQKKQLIDKIIESDPGRIKLGSNKFFTPAADAKQSLLENEHLVTETLAKIYALQGNISKAIRAYEILSLKFPQKSVYFASLIEKLKTNK
ncbi:MAG: hypothetical protein K0S53_325 [Bacteroidetes bacterium]|jgi:hypothetical protein|nr:hypothetical protein [Bacteroidota bacterium]MDF2452050.1 hypothetical protein [Bacteroidota bacterium]